MSGVYPITPDIPACYGILCERRKTCQRYEAVEHTLVDHTVANCGDDHGGRPLYIPIRSEATCETQ